MSKSNAHNLPHYKFKGILFDLDGVITDTMQFHVEAWCSAILPYGLEVSGQEIYLREGEKGAVTAHDLLKMAGVNPTTQAVEKLIKEKEVIFKSISRPCLFPDAVSSLELFHRKGYCLGLVSGSFLTEVETSLGPHLLHLFSVVVAGDQVHRGKPHPEPYEKALQGLKLNPHEVLVVENAPYGIKSAKAAGLACIALTTSLPERFLADADLVVANLKEVVKYLEKG